MIGGAGNDVLLGQGSNDTLYRTQGRAWLKGGSGHDVVFGGDGLDPSVGSGGNAPL